MHWATDEYFSAPVKVGNTLVTLLAAGQFVLLHVLTVERFSDETVLSSLQCFNTKRAGERRTCSERPIYSFLPLKTRILLLCQVFKHMQCFILLCCLQVQSFQKPSVKLFCGLCVTSTWLQTFWKLSSPAAWYVSAVVFQCFHSSLWYIPTQTEKGPFLAAEYKLPLRVSLT